MKKVVNKVPIHNKNGDYEFWKKQPSLKRLEALESIRREYHQWKYDSEPRFHRVYSITKR